VQPEFTEAPVPVTFDLQTFLDAAGASRTYKKSEIVFSQGACARTVFYIRHGMLQLTVSSTQGRKAIIGVLGAGEFVGEACLAGKSTLSATATAKTDVTVVEVDKATMGQALADEPALTQLFMSFLLLRHVQLEADLADRMFTSDQGPPSRHFRDYIRVVPK
jgi:CRP-like cAMP-binding protein